MKNLILAGIIYLIPFFVNAQKINSDAIPYGKGVEFKVEYYINSKRISDPITSRSVTVYKAPKYRIFKQGVYTFTNNSNEDQIINFKKFYILDEQDERHYAKFVVQSMRINSNNKELEKTLKAGKTKTFIIDFFPSLPKGQTPRFGVDESLEIYED